MSYIITS